MPDQFVPYPSPVTSWGSPTMTRGVDPTHLTVADPPSLWPADSSFDPVYTPGVPDQVQMTDEQLAILREIENYIDDHPAPLPDSVAYVPDVQANHVDLFSLGENVVPQFSFGSNGSYLEPNLQPPTPHDSPTYPAHPQPRYQPGPLSPLALNGPVTFPPSPPLLYDQYQPRPREVQPYRPSPSQPAPNQIQRRPGEPDRMVLPGVGDLDVSMCEVIM